MPADDPGMDQDNAILDELAAVAESLGADCEEFRAMRSSRIYEALEDLGADRVLLAVVGSWRDTLNDDQVLEYLRSWNQSGGRFKLDHGLVSTSKR